MSRFSESVGAQFAEIIGLTSAALVAGSSSKDSRDSAKDPKYSAIVDEANQKIKKANETIQSFIQANEELVRQVNEANQKIRQANEELARQANESQRWRAKLDSERLAQNIQARSKELEYEARIHAAQEHVADLERKLKEMESQGEKAALELRSKGQQSVSQLKFWHAANLALRCALEMQLLRVDPENPLLQDQDLRERVRNAGQMAVSMLEQVPGADKDPHAPDPFDMAREAGLTFSVPGRPSSTAVLSDLILADVYMERIRHLDVPLEKTALAILDGLQNGQGAASAARELLSQVEPRSKLLTEDTARRVQEIAMDEFQAQQQRRRMEKDGPNALWSASMLGQKRLRERALEEFEREIGERNE